MECLLCNKKYLPLFQIETLWSFKPLDNQSGICSECNTNFSYYKELKNLCLGCYRTNEYPLCNDCSEWQEKYPEIQNQHKALLMYNYQLKEWFRKFKFQGNPQLSYCFSDFLSLFFKRFYKNYIVVPIPISEERRQIRGFNQTTELLKAARIPYVQMLEKNLEVESSTKKTRTERLQSVQPFKIKRVDNSLIDGKEIVIFDDVYTTGATLYHALDCLKNQPYSKICTSSLAR